MASDPGQALRKELGVKSPEKIEYLKVLVFGESGAGKTTLCGTSMDSELSSPVFLIDVEGGTTVLNDKPNVDVKAARAMAEIQAIADTLHQYPKYYKTVILDSLTELRDIDMQEVMMEQYKKKPETTDKYVPSPREWGKSGARVKEILRYLKDLPCHVVVTTLMTENQDMATGVKTIEPLLPGQLQKQVSGFFDIVGYLRARMVQGQNVRTIQFVRTDKVMAKDRTKALPDILEDPTIPKIWDIIFKAGATIDRTVAPELLAQVQQDSNVTQLKQEK